MNRYGKKLLNILTVIATNEARAKGYYTDSGLIDIISNAPYDKGQEALVLRLVCTNTDDKTLKLYDFEESNASGIQFITVWVTEVPKIAYYKANKKYDIKGNRLLFEYELDTIREFEKHLEREYVEDISVNAFKVNYVNKNISNS